MRPRYYPGFCGLLFFLILNAIILPALAQTHPATKRAIPAVEAIRGYLFETLDDIDFENIEFDPSERWSGQNSLTWLCMNRTKPLHELKPIRS